MHRIEAISHKIRTHGFQCLQCGACCRGDEQTSRVIISPPEIDWIIEATGLERNGIVVPYPEYIESVEGGWFTFEWCLKNEDGRCIFLDEDGRCSIYSARPWICRTYPFALDGDALTISDCPGIGGEITLEEADALAACLVKRQKAEEEEENAVLKIFSSHTIPVGKNVVFDSRGMWNIHG